VKPGTKWIAAIVGFLGANVLATVVLAATAAHGGSEVIPDYYEKGVHYDDAIDRAAASKALGWRVDATLAGDELTVTVRDRAGAPMTGARVTATGYARAAAGTRISIALTPDGGRYHGATHTRTGMHDLVIAVERDGVRFEQAMAIEAR
jgi:nitrogen fixation protein FixH